MFKSARWRGEKNKITFVFKLRFHATQVSQPGGNALVLSLVPLDTGKPTAKLEKSTIRDGCCYWEDAVYETVKFIQDPKTGKFHERIYNFILSAGLPKSSLVGEVSVNIADYVEATKAASVSLPFKSSNSEGVLHVLIQRIQGNADQRDFEENGVANIKEGDRSLKRHFSNGDTEEGTKINSTEDEPLRKTMSHIAGSNGDRRTSSGSDITLSSSESSSGLNTPRELGVKSNSIHHAVNASNYHEQQRTRWEWSLVPAPDASTEESLNSPRDAFPSGRSNLSAEDSVEKLKSNLVVLARKVEVSELELQTLRKQIVKESKRGQELLTEVASLKEERDVLKEECEKLKSSQKWGDGLKVRSKLKFEGDPRAILEEIRQELSYEKDLNANLRLQLQKTQESNSELILAVQDLEQMLQHNNGGNSDPSMRPAVSKQTEELDDGNLECQSSDDEEQKALEELVRQHSDAKEAYLLEQKIMDLCSEIEMYRRDKDELEMQMEQLALDYEIMKQENHDISYKLEQSQLQEQLKLQYECSSSYATINELETQIEQLESELKSQSEEFSESLATIKKLETHIENLEEDLEKQAQRFGVDLKAASSAKIELEVKSKRLENELKNQSKEFSASLATIKHLQTQIQKLEEELEKQAQRFEADLGAVTHAKVDQELKIENLENELKNQSRAVSNSSAVIKELETHIQNLEDELVEQSQGFEANLEALTRAKVEQEQRAIRAEEALRLTRCKNVNTAERLQEEFKRLSMQMQSTFEANEKLATKALTEASELRLQNNHLQEMLRKAADELQSVQDNYEAKLRELSNKKSMKSRQIDQMVEESEEKFKQLEDQKKHEDEVCQCFSEELSTLRDEVEKLKADNHLLSQQARQLEGLKAELELMENSIKERERENIEGTIALMKEEAEKSQEEFNALRCLHNEKELVITKLQSEVDTLKIQCGDSRHSLYEDELEKEKLRKQVFQLKADLKKKEDTIMSMERKLKDTNGRVAFTDRTKATSKSSKPEVVPRGVKDVAALKEKIKLLEEKIKIKEAALETSANAFLGKEKDLHKKIEELERRLEEFEPSGTTLSGDVFKKGDGNAEDTTLNGNMCEERNTSTKNSSNTACMPIENAGMATELVSRSEEILLEAQLTTSITNSREQDIDGLSKEIVLLKEKNISMESELKDMQRRYSEISLKFAEVEGERQQLVMSLRNLKNAKKS
ncbi:hypothetical protein Ancab_014796 [Ancistrocladus abbreviatus]